MKKQFIIPTKYLVILLGIAVLFGLYLTSLYNYLLFHSLAEIFSIVVACGIFMITWNSRQFLDNNYLLFIGIAFLFVGGLDLIHTLAYTGMGVFQGYKTNLPTQLWIAARYLEGISLFVAPLFFSRKLKPNFLFLGYTVVTTLLLLSIFYWDVFPICFLEGVGLTPFKKVSEYIICLIFLASIALLLRNRREFDKNVLQWVIWSILITIFSELFFTFYTHAYGFSNLLGHFFKIVSFYFIYKAIIETGLTRPYALLLRNLKQSEERFRSIFEKSPIGIEFYDSVGQLVDMNKSCLEMFGVSDVEKVKGLKLFEDPNLSEEVKENLKRGKPVRYEPLLDFQKVKEHKLYETTKSGVRYLDVSITPLGEWQEGDQSGYLVQVQDITGRKRAEETLEVSNRFLQIINKQMGMTPLLKEFLVEIRNLTGCSAVGVRLLDDAGNIPYQAYAGFSQEFYQKESPLSIKSDQCMCINVIKGGIDPGLPFYTAGGSFYINATSRFLATVSEKEKGKTRNECNRIGFESVALVPIPIGDGILGLIHVADPRENMVPLEMVELLERVSMQLGTGIHRVRTEEALQKAHNGLEIRVQERTAELATSNQALQFEIEERKQAEEALRQSEMKYRIVADNTYDWEWWRDPEGNFIYVSPSCKGVTHHEAEEFIKDPGLLLKIIHPDDKTSFINHQNETEKEIFPGEVEFRIFHPDGSFRWLTHACQPVFDEQGRFLGRRGNNRDITERKEIEKRVQATNALLNLFARIPSRKDYLDAVLELIQNWTSCRCAGIRILDRQGNIPYESYVGFSREFWESENFLSVKNNQCVCIRVITGEMDPQDAPVVTPAGSFCCGNTIRFIQKLSEEEKKRYRGACVENGFLSVAVISIRYGERILGAIHLADEMENRVSFKVLEFIESMAPLIGEAIHRFNLEEELRESESRLRLLSSQLLTVQEAERKRIASEIHDGLGQTLTAIKFSLESKLSQMGKSTTLPGILLENIISLASNGIEEARRLQTDLRPSLLDDLGILATIGWFTREFQKVYVHISVEKQISVEENEIPDSLRTVLFRVTQEAMNNVAKHSKANLARLSFRKIDDRIKLSIKDNGAGFDPETIKQGLGLTSMRERTELSGGTFEVESILGKGTTIRASWPI
jgi:PAS domain S-box-containing protein